MAARRGTHRLLTGARFSVRFRLTVTATAFAAATFLATSAVTLSIYGHNLNVERKRSLAQTAEGAAAQVAIGALQLSDGVPKGVTASVQILDGGNRVIYGDSESMRKPPMLVLQAGQTERAAEIVNPTFRPEDRVYVIARRVQTPNGDLTVVLADSLDIIDKQISRAQVEAILGVLLFLPIVAALSWLVVGRTLRPVERLRTQVAAITKGSDLSRRVPQSQGRDEISRLAGTLNEMLRVLDDAASTQRRFVADAAHELRTPLAGMTAYLEVAANHPDLIEPSTLVDRLLSANSHLSDLVNDLLTLAILDAKAPIKYRPVCLAGIVQDGMRHLDAAKIRVEERIVGPAMVLGNPTHLTRVVTNLVGNAIRHATSAVVVTVHTTEAHAVFTVIDDGPGIPAEHRYRIWQRFVRFDDDRARATGGTGLGLALVREIVTAHGGGVRVGDAAPGPGAVFAARIPLVSLGQAAPRPAAAQPSATALTRDDSRPSVLLQQP